MLTTLATAEEQLRDIGIDPYAVGAIAIAILLMLALLQFGKGREHS